MLNHLLSKGHDQDPSTRGFVMRLIAIMLPATIDPYLAETLFEYQSSYLDQEGPSIPTKLNVFREDQCQWWTVAEWSKKGGEDAFWERMAECPSKPA